MKKCPHCGADMDDTAVFCSHCGSRYNDTPKTPDASTSNPVSPDESSYPMRWHRFQMVTMIIGAVLTVLSGFANMNGSAYLAEGLDPSVIYNAYPALRTCDTAYGVAGIVIGVFQLYTRNQLKGFCRNAPRTLTVFYLFSLTVQIVYIGAVSSVLKTNTFSTAWSALAGSILMMFINGVYYKHRQTLFVR